MKLQSYFFGIVACVFSTQSFCAVQKPRIVVGVAAKQGTRPDMEDRATPYSKSPIDPQSLGNYFAVFDGHGSKGAGADAAEFALEQLPNAINHFFTEFCTDPITQAFRHVHQQFLTRYGNSTGGTTVTIALMRATDFLIANIGDTEAVLCCKDPGTKKYTFQALTTKHSLDLGEEQIRIRQLEVQELEKTNHGQVIKIDSCISFLTVVKPNLISILTGYPLEGDPIILDNQPKNVTYLAYFNQRRIAVSRALGDKDEQPFISPDPAIKVHSYNGNETFLIIASDGLWDVMTYQGACEYVLRLMKDRGFFTKPITPQAAQNIAKKLTKSAIKKLKSDDNVTAMVLFFQY